jgi:hypothetical protein
MKGDEKNGKKGGKKKVNFFYQTIKNSKKTT